MEIMEVSSLGYLLLSNLFYVFLGCILGVVFRVFVKPPKTFWNGYVVACTFGNWGDLTNAVIMALGNDPPFKQGDIDLGIAYTSVFNFPSTLLLFSAGYRLLKKDFDHAEDNLQLNSDSVTIEPPVEARPSFNFKEFVWDFTKKLFNPPNIAMVAALILGGVPVFRSIFISPDTSLTPAERTAEAPLGFLLETTEFLGDACVQMGVLNIGASFMRVIQGFTASLKKKDDDYDGSNSISKQNVMEALSVSFIRLILIPIIGIAFWEFMMTQALSVISMEDKMLRFVLMFQSLVPTAQMVILLSQLLDPSGKGWNVSCVSILQYFLSLITISGWLTGIYYLLMS